MGERERRTVRNDDAPSPFFLEEKEHVRWALSYCTCLLGRASLVAKWLARSLHNTDHDPIESP